MPKFEYMHKRAKHLPHGSRNGWGSRSSWMSRGNCHWTSKTTNHHYHVLRLDIDSSDSVIRRHYRFSRNHSKGVAREKWIEGCYIQLTCPKAWKGNQDCDEVLMDCYNIAWLKSRCTPPNFHLSPRLNPGGARGRAPLWPKKQKSCNSKIQGCFGGK